MTKDEFAAKLHGREYGDEITDAEAAEAKAAGLIVIFGYSDDNVELRGAIYDEVGMYDGGTICITPDGKLMPMWESIDHSDKDAARAYFQQEALPRFTIDCEFSPPNEEMTWRYKTDLPHATFDVIEGSDIFCRGIVIDTKDLQS